MLVRRKKNTRNADASGVKVSRHLKAVCLVLAAGVCTPALAQSTSLADRVAALPAASPVSASPASLGATHGARPDTSALRYYAVRGEQERVQAEIRRLKALYPNWKQPKNIFADQSVEETKLWALFAKGDTSKVRAAIGELQESDNGFTPSVDLLDKLERRESRDDIARAWSQKKWQDVINQVNADPDLLVGTDVELIWFVAEAYARLERPEDSLDAFQAAFASATTREQRKATMQKAAALLSTDAALKLLDAFEEEDADSVLRGEVEEAIVRGALARSAEMGEAPPAVLKEHIARFEQRTRVSGSHLDAILLAWSAFGQSDWQRAHNWFAHAVELKDDVKAAEGMVMSAKRMQQTALARGLAEKWKDRSDELGRLYLGLAAPDLLQEKPRRLPATFLERYASKTLMINSGEGAEALGWYAFNVRQFDAARAWFTKATLWEETETSVYGMALTAATTRDRAVFDELKQAYSDRYEKVASLKWRVPKKRRKPVLVRRVSSNKTKAGKLRLKIAGLHKAKRFTQCLKSSRQLRKYGPLNAGDHQMRGWCLMGAKRPAEAERAFAAALKRGGKGKVPSAYGQALAALRSGKTNEALQIANANQLTASQRRTIDIELLTQRARAAFDNRDYGASVYALDERRKLTPEPRDLSFMRAWAHYHSGNRRVAGQIFELLDNQLSTSETRRGLGAVRLTREREVSGDA